MSTGIVEAKPRSSLEAKGMAVATGELSWDEKRRKKPAAFRYYLWLVSADEGQD